MAELILTPAEKAAHTWLELDDATVGKVTKKVALTMVKFSEEHDAIAFVSAAMLLCSYAAQLGSNPWEQYITGLRAEGRDFGDWKLTIQRIGTE